MIKGEGFECLCDFAFGVYGEYGKLIVAGGKAVEIDLGAVIFLIVENPVHGFFKVFVVHLHFLLKSGGDLFLKQGKGGVRVCLEGGNNAVFLCKVNDDGIVVAAVSAAYFKYFKLAFAVVAFNPVASLVLHFPVKAAGVRRSNLAGGDDCLELSGIEDDIVGAFGNGDVAALVYQGKFLADDQSVGCAKVIAAPLLVAAELEFSAEGNTCGLPLFRGIGCLCELYVAGPLIECADKAPYGCAGKIHLRRLFGLDNLDVSGGFLGVDGGAVCGRECKYGLLAIFYGGKVYAHLNGGLLCACFNGNAAFK